MPTARKNALIFDFHGILIPSFRNHLETWKIILDQHNLSNKINEVASALREGKPTDQIVMFLDADARKQKILVEEKRILYDRVLHSNASLFPNEKKAIRELSKIANLYVLTLYQKISVLQVLRTLRIAEYFDDIFGRTEMNESISRKELFANFFSQCKFSKTIYITDTINDLTLVRNMGAGFILMSMDNPDLHHKESASNHITSYFDLVDMVKQFMEKNG